MRYGLLFFFILVGFSGSAQKDSTVNALNEVVVKATRASIKTGMAFTEVRKEQLEKQNLAQDLPFLLNQQPSVVVTSDAGAGIGYTGIRIRGTDPTRINVTINGVPYNDSESQGVFWVNMPDISSSISSVQIQRGVGTSTNGAGAFGATINVNTLQYESEPYGEINTTVGSFNTLKTNVMASTGLLSNGFVLDARMSRIVSDGWVDRASSNLRSFYLSGGWYGKNSFVRMNVFSGKERTYQSWYGIPESLAKGDEVGLQNFIDRNFIDSEFAAKMRASGRQFNWYQYENEVDNYQQDHYQLIASFKVGENWRFNPTLHYTYGRGFFEQFRAGESFTDYGLSNLQIGETLVTETDLVRRKWLDNHFYGTVWSLDYEGKGPLQATLGGGWNQYLGDHFGDVIWAQFASDGAKDFRWYENLGEKQDFNVFAKGTYQHTSKLNSYVDLQIRSVSLDINGTLDSQAETAVSQELLFFNPKAGFNFQVSSKNAIYGSFAVGNKEPSRQDFVDNPVNPPAHEQLLDLEIGYRYMTSSSLFEANFYNMQYRNQLVLTGNINDVGEAIRVNVPNSRRTGLELQYGHTPNKYLQWAINATFSDNKIREFEEVIVSYDGTENMVNTFENTHISFSPSLIAGGAISVLPSEGLEISLLPKYVGRQYLDNTSNINRSIDPYFVGDLRFTYDLPQSLFKNVRLSLLVNNLFNAVYEANGYTYSYNFEGVVTENFLYPQAGTNFLAALKWRF